MTNYCVCPACGHELAVSTTSEIDALKRENATLKHHLNPTAESFCYACGYQEGTHHPSCKNLKTPSDIPKQMSREFNEYIEERDNQVLNEWSSRWQ